MDATDRTVFSNNALEEVICAIRYPSTLRIQESPSLFQERLRSSNRTISYPECPEPPQLLQGLQLGIPFATLISGQGFQPIQFQSADRKWTISLSHEYTSLVTTGYRRWEEFSEEVQFIFGLLFELYKPPYLNRVGLRYKNIIRPGKLDIVAPPWNSYLRPHILAEMADSGSAELEGAEIEISAKRTLFKYSDRGQTLLQHGLGAIGIGQCYVIDIDVFTDQRTETNDITTRLQEFNKRAGRIFRWCITPELQRAMGPIPPGDERSGRDQCA